MNVGYCHICGREKEYDPRHPNSGKQCPIHPNENERKIDVSSLFENTFEEALKIALESLKLRHSSISKSDILTDEEKEPLLDKLANAIQIIEDKLEGLS